MKPSGIGGQAVIEGIMMRNKDKYSIAVRKPDKQIEVVVKESKLLTEKHKWLNYPIIRGVFNFVDSLVTGISTINYSASFYDDPEEQNTTKADELGKAVFKEKMESVLMAVTIILSVIFAVGLFMLLPYFISRLLKDYISSKFVLNLLEGIVRLVIFIAYITAISMMKDIKRTYMYHGAEHKCINCIENGLILTPENVKNSSRFHKRCGTSFLFLVMFISIIFFIFIRVDNTALQIVIRVLLIPVIAGVSYEIIRLAGKSDGKLINIVSKPGIWMQHLTTKEPDMDMIEVAIKAVEAVFDWKTFLIDYYKDSDTPFEDMEAKEIEVALTSDLISNKENTRTIKTKDLKKKHKNAHSKESRMNVSSLGFMEDKFKSVCEESDDSESTELDNYNEDNSIEEEDVLAGFEIEDDDVFENTFINKANIDYTGDVVDKDNAENDNVKQSIQDDNSSEVSQNSEKDNKTVKNNSKKKSRKNKSKKNNYKQNISDKEKSDINKATQNKKVDNTVNKDNIDNVVNDDVLEDDGIEFLDDIENDNNI